MRDRFGFSGTDALLFGGGVFGGLALTYTVQQNLPLILGAVGLGAVLYLRK